MHPPGTPSDPLHTWRPASDRSNVLIVAPSSAGYLDALTSLRKGKPPCEVVSMDSTQDSLRLVRRGSIAVVVLDGHPGEAGSLEFIIESLAKQRPPIFLILTRKPGPGAPLHRRIRTAAAGMDYALLKNLVLEAAGQFEEDSVPRSVSAFELLESAAGFPDEAWLRVTNEREESGDLCVRAGRIVYSEVERLSGSRAAARILSWNDCRFECRELPAFLGKNMDHPLDNLSALAQGAPTQYQSAPPPAPAPSTEAAIEEPLDFPSLASYVDELSAAPEPGRGGDIEEPLMMPEFMADLPEAQCGNGFSPAAGDFLEEPAELTFETGMAEPPPEVPRKETGFISVSGSVFAAVAVIAAGDPEIEICMPERERPYFDGPLLRGLYDQARQCASLRRMDAPSSVRIRSAEGTLALEPVPGSSRLVAAYVKDGGFGPREEAELRCLVENLPAVVR